MKIIKKISTWVVMGTFILLGLGALFAIGTGVYAFAEALYPVVGWWNIPIIIGGFIFLALFVIGMIELERGR